MQFSYLSKLNFACASCFQRVVTGQRIRPRNFVVQLFSASASFEGQTLNRRKPMAASGSQSVSGDVYVDTLFTSCGTAVDPLKPSVVFFGDRSIRSCQKASVSLRNSEPLTIRLACRSFLSGVTLRSYNSRLVIRPCLRNVNTLPPQCYSKEPGSNIPFSISSPDERLENLADSSVGNDIGKTTFKLLSGSSYLPHPDKQETGGEDAHFICEDEQVIGVADGVGGWADVGVDAGIYARDLMSNSVAAVKEEPVDSIDPARVLEKAHSVTRVIGSSTACIIALTNKGVHAINLGDSGFIVIRDGSTVFRSPAQQYGFNFPYQLASGPEGDVPSSGQVFAFPIEPGDVIAAGTDGLFDNLYDNEISAVVVQSVRAGHEPQVTAQNLAALAQERAKDRNRQTPFAAAAHEAGFRYVGGKLDDITVVVSYITDASNL